MVTKPRPGPAPFATRSGMVEDDSSARSRSRPNSGWSLTYRPSISRSAESFSMRSHSTSGMVMAPTSSAVASVAWPNSENCPSASARFVDSACSTAGSKAIRRPLRGCGRSGVDSDS